MIEEEESKRFCTIDVTQISISEVFEFYANLWLKLRKEGQSLLSDECHRICEDLEGITNAYLNDAPEKQAGIRTTEEFFEELTRKN